MSRYKDLDSLHVKVALHLNDKAGAAGEYWFKKPYFQRCFMTSSLGQEELIANQKAIVLFDRTNLDYGQFPSQSEVTSAPPGATNYLSYGLPRFFGMGGLKAFGESKQWVRIEPETIEGQLCDGLVLVKPGESAGQGKTKAWVNLAGDIVRFQAEILTNESVLQLNIDFHDFDRSSLLVSFFDTSIPDGYMPSRIPKTFEPAGTGDTVSLGSCFDLETGKEVRLKDLEEGKALILFISNDLADECSVDWGWLAQEAKAKKLRFFIIALGKEPKNFQGKLKIYWDKYGEIERGVGISGTPFAIGIRDRQIVSAWQGLVRDRKTVAEGLITPLLEN